MPRLYLIAWTGSSAVNAPITRHPLRILHVEYDPNDRELAEIVAHGDQGLQRRCAQHNDVTVLGVRGRRIVKQYRREPARGFPADGGFGD